MNCITQQKQSLLRTPKFKALTPLLALLAAIVGGTAHGQHDGYREAVIEITSGQPERAQSRLERLLEDPGSLWRRQGGPYSRVGATLKKQGENYRKFVEPEAHYTLAILHSLQGDGPKAAEHAKAALEAGLSIERFLVGPRDAFAALYETDDFKQWAARDSASLLHGPMLGHVTGDAVSVWVRTADESDVTVEVTPVSGSATISATGTTCSEKDYTAVIRVSGLQTDTEHRYQVLIDGEAAELSDPVFRTHPPQGESSGFRVAFTACAGYAPEHERIWQTIKKQEPLALLMLGDNVYIDDPEHSLTQRFCYYRRYSRPEWRDLVANTGVYAIWDDHDFGANDSFGGPEVDKPAWKPEVIDVFRQNWNNPAYGGGSEQPGVWFDFHIGDVHFIMLDGRYYREPNGQHRKHPPQSDTPSMLGPAQLAWLKQTLRTSEATFKVIASPVPWADGTTRGNNRLDKWEGYPAEREAIFDHLAKHEINGVVLISGDRHRSDARRIDRENGYSLYDFMSAITTNYHTHPLVEGPGYLFGYNENNNFGTLDFDTTLDDPRMVFEIRTIDDELIWSHALHLSELSH